MPGRNSDETRQPMTLREAIILIKAKNYPKDTEEELIKAVSRQPTNTYEKFLQNIHTHLRRIQIARKKNKK